MEKAGRNVSHPNQTPHFQPALTTQMRSLLPPAQRSANIAVYLLFCLVFSLIPLSVQAEKLHKVVVQLQWKHQFEFAGFYAAVHKGYYRRIGLDVELREYENGMQVTEEVLSGRVQYGVFHSGLIQARLEGRPVKLLANYFKKLPMVILTRPPIATLQELRGGKLMIGGKDLNSPLIKAVLAEEGIVPGRDIEIVPHTFNAEPFIRGEVDAMTAFITNEPFYLQNDNIRFNVISLSDYTRSMGELYLFTSEENGDREPQLTRSFVEATNSGYRYALSNKEEIVDLILDKYSQRKSREALLYEADQTEKMILPLPLPIGSVFEPMIREVAELIMEQENIRDEGHLENFIFKMDPDSQHFLLTGKEKDYLAGRKFHRQLSYGWMPFNMKAGDGQILGLSEDYWALIRDRLGLLEDTSGEPVLFARVLEAMQAGRTDIYPSASRTEDREAYAVFSDKYESFPIAIATNRKTEFIFDAAMLEGQVVAVGRNYSAFHLMKARYPDISFLHVTNTREAIEKVISGEAYAAIDILPVLQYQLNRLSRDEVKIGGVTEVQFPVQVMVRKEHARLVPLINRAIASITPEERANLHRKWMMQEIVAKTDYSLLWKVLGAGAVLIALILMWNRRLALEIVKRKKVETQLRKLTQAVEQSQNTIVITDTDGRIEYVNPAFTASSGFEEAEAIGQNPRILKSGFHEDSFYGSMWDDLLVQGSWKGEICNKRKDSSLYWVSATISPIMDENGHASHYLAVLEDISERKKVEEERENLTRQLHQAQKLETIGLMAGGVAHDLNNILAGIVGYPELMLEELPGDSRWKVPLKAIQESGERAAAVVSDLLAVARGVASTREQHDLHGLIRSHLESLEHKQLMMRHPQVALNENFGAERSIISCSAVHVSKCIMNLVTNAVEAIGLAGSVVISTANVDDQIGFEQSETFVVVTVADTGPGIDRNDLEHIFEPFYSKKVMGRSGSGLGLTVVWTTMEDHGGRVTVDSNNKGTSFHLYFPVSREAAVPSSVLEQVDIRAADCERILVVDDDPVVRDLACLMLRSLGYQVETVDSGEEAIRFLQTGIVDLVVLDMLMEPGMNGLQTYREILKLYPEQKAIIASGFSESRDVKDALQLGAGGFIKKPYLKQQLGALIRDVLAG
jgi:PAS domain S-box-containing protein